MVLKVIMLVVFFAIMFSLTRAKSVCLIFKLKYVFSISVFKIFVLSV